MPLSSQRAVMDINNELAARCLVGDQPHWTDLQRWGASTNPLVRQAAMDAAALCTEMPAPVRQVLAEVALLGTGRASTWTARFHRLRAGGHATRFVAELLQQAAVDPVPVLVDLMRQPEMAWIAADCRGHQSAAVRAMARAVAGDRPLAASRPNGKAISW